MLKRFSEITMKDVNTCGGKGASLGEMRKAGLPIPDGFVLTTNAYGANQGEREQEALQAFDKLNTKFVAVRSSGTKEDGLDDSFAGQFDTYLYVTRENLIEKVKECHASVNSERILSYCEYKGIDIKSIKVAVVVQKMVNSESAGVCFTVNPVSQNQDEIMIDAGYGIGESVVSGMITPDNYIVNKKTQEIKKNISQQEKKIVLSDKGGTKEVKISEKEQETQKLSDKHIQELAELVKKIEKHYGKPMDVEWAIENGELFMLQARPITTLNKKSDDGNMSFSEMLNNAVLVTGREASVQRDILLGNHFMHNKYFSMNYWFAIPESGSLSSTGYYFPKDEFTKFLSGIGEEFLHPGFLGEYIKRGQMRGEKYYSIYSKIYKDFSEQDVEVNDKIIEDVKALYEYSISNDTYYYFLLSGWAFDQITIPQFKNELKSYFGKDFEKKRNIITSQTEITDEQKFRIELANLKKQYGNNISTEILIKLEKKRRYLGTYNPNDYGYDSECILKIYNDIDIDHELSIPELIKVNKNKFQSLLNSNKSQERLCEIMKLINYNVYFRTIRMETMMKCYVLLTPMYEYLMKKLNLNRVEVGNITDTEILEFLKNGTPPKRRSSRPYFLYLPNGAREFSEQEIQLTNIKFGNNIVLDEFKGDIAYRGKVVGTVKIITSERDMNKVNDGDVIVARFTKPGYIPAMKKASAFITNDGGITCHAAIVARELGKPCIIGTKVATKVLKDGDLVEVDANNGIVKIIKQ